MTSSAELLISRRVRASTDAVGALTIELLDAQPPGVDEAAWGQACLGISEAMTNVARHGTQGHADVWIELRVELGEQGLVARISDNGAAIPASEWSKADGSVFDFDPLAVDALPVGGMGLSLIRQVFHDVQYVSGRGLNSLRLALCPAGQS